MTGGGEVYQEAEGGWSFRVMSPGGKVEGTGYATEIEARTALGALLQGDYNGPITATQHLACGQLITASTTLKANLVCASGPALIVTADNVVLDLGGHTVSGNGTTSAVAPGILLRNVKGVTVQKGTVQHFGAGVAISGGSGNVVQNMTLQDNLGNPTGDFGDGLVITDSADNHITGNTVRRNGPFSGISIVGASTGNNIDQNVVSDNNMLPGTPSAGRQDMGIRIEGPSANNNKVVGNTVSGSGGDGIVVLATCANPSTGCAGTPPNVGNEITQNMSHNNGTSGTGSGVRLFAVPAAVAPANTTVNGNITDGNVTNGVSVDAVGASNPGPPKNLLSGNQGKGNGQFDGFDGNTPACGSNVWSGNTFAKTNQPCIGAAAHPGPRP